MWLGDGYTDLPSGKLANVVTCLEMLERAPERSEASGDYALERLDGADLHRYRRVFRRIGEAYLWCSRLTMSDDELAAIVRNPSVEVYVLRSGGEDAGILELDFRQADECELTFFGVADRLVGSGAGRWLMNRAIKHAWSHPIQRFWVHTCTLDHPGAVAFYMRSGFVPFKRQIEVLDDPRVSGILPRDAAPDVPVL